MEETVAVQLVGPHREDPGSKKSTKDVSQHGTYIVSSPGDGNILSWVNSLLSGAYNPSGPSEHNGRPHLGGVHLLVETSRREGWRGEEEQKKPPPSHIFFHQDRSKEISKLCVSQLNVRTSKQ